MNPLTDAEIQAIKERCERATAGPWDLPLLSLIARTDIPALLAEVERLGKLAELWSREEATQYRELVLTVTKVDEEKFKAIQYNRDQLTAELASAKADTARLDWLCTGKNIDRTHHAAEGGFFVDGGFETQATLREAIDGAMKGQPDH